jgi:hypothetical protein
MKNPHEVLKFKEQEVLRVRSEINALKIAVRLLSDDGDSGQRQDNRVMEMPQN